MTLLKVETVRTAASLEQQHVRATHRRPGLAAPLLGSRGFFAELQVSPWRALLALGGAVAGPQRQRRGSPVRAPTDRSALPRGGRGRHRGVPTVSG